MGAFNGSGVFVRSYSWTADAANNIDITASRMDTEDTGFASGLSLCVTRDGQGQMAANYLPSADATYDLGSGSFRWGNLYLSGNANITGNANVTGNAAVTGNITANALTLAGASASMPPVVGAAKTSSTSRSSTTTATIDPALQVVLGTGTYGFELFVMDGTGANSPGGLKGTIAYSGSLSVGNWGMQGTGAGISNVPLVTVNVVAQQMQASQNSQENMWITGGIITTGPGVLSFNWAQNSSNGTASVVAAGSWIRATKFA